MRNLAGRENRPIMAGHQQPDDPCSIYFIQCETTGLVKIGMAGDARSRFSSIQSGSPTILTLKASFEGRRADEAALHERFREHRDHGEWFKPVPDLLAYIADVRAAEAKKYETIFFSPPLRTT